MKLSEINYKSYDNYKTKELSTDLVKAGLKLNNKYTELGEIYFDNFKKNYDFNEFDYIKINSSFYVKSKYGNRDLVSCNDCNYTFDSNSEENIARYFDEEKNLPKKLLLTEGATSIKKLIPFVNVDPSKIVKTMIYKTNKGFVAILVLGDRNVNLEKVKSFLNIHEIELASIEDVSRLTNAELGYAGPIDLQIPIYADYELKNIKNFVVGANKTNYHYINVNNSDLSIVEFSDFKVLNKSDLCPKCGGKILFEKSLLLKEGNKKNYDSAFSYAFSNNLFNPIDFLIIVLKKEFMNEVEKLYTSLASENQNILIDDRDEKPFIKFNSGELLKPKKIIVIGNKLNEGLVEIRSNGDTSLINISEILKSL